MTNVSTNLSIDDIADTRAYEREREDLRRHVISLKKRRRVGVGPVLTLLFENRDTIRFQIQEMARAERILTDDGIQAELDIYNPLIPEPGHLAATLFIELTTESELRQWLPRLVGIETMIELRVGPDAQPVRCIVDREHSKQLTRDEITASVHYIGFALTPEQVEAFGNGPVVVAATHPEYQHEVDLGPQSREELLADLRG